MRKMTIFSLFMHIVAIFIIFRLANITFRFKDRIPEKEVKILTLIEKTPQPKIIKEQITPQEKAPTPAPSPTPKVEKTPEPTPEEKKLTSPEPTSTPKMQIQKKDAVKTPKAKVEPSPHPQIASMTTPLPRYTPKPIVTPTITEQLPISMEVESFPFDYYKELVRGRILENYSVPSIVAQKNLKCLFKLVVGKNGEVLSYSLIKTSGDQMLDQSALKAIQYTSFPPLPAGYRRGSVTFVLTFTPHME